MIAPRSGCDPSRISRAEIPQCSGPRRTGCAFGCGGGTGASSDASRPDLERFRSAPRTSRLCRGSLRVPHRLLSWEVHHERARCKPGAERASDIIGVVRGVGLYSVLFFLVTFLCLYVPA